MEVSDYVARRMFFEVYDIEMLLNMDFESVYDDLYEWMERYTEQFGDLFYRLPSCKSTSDELMNDLTLLYTGILDRIDDIESITTLNALFTVSFYMMVKYRNQQPFMCGYISYYFKLVTQRLESWGHYYAH